MTNTPLTSADQSKVFIFTILLLPTIFLALTGVVPVLFLSFSVFMMKKNSDFSHIETAAKIYKWYLMLIVAIAIMFALYFATTLSAENSYQRHGDEFIGSLVAIGIAGLYLTIGNFLFFNPLQDHAEWVEKNGIFARKEKQERSDSERGDFKIIGGDKLRSFSVADELLKWAKLKEDGNITEQEYNEARKKLLQNN